MDGDRLHERTSERGDEGAETERSEEARDRGAVSLVRGARAVGLVQERSGRDGRE